MFFSYEVRFEHLKFTDDVGHFVIIEADNNSEADRILDQFSDRTCWYRPSRKEQVHVALYSLKDFMMKHPRCEWSSYSSWHIVVHYKNGRKEIIQKAE